MRQTHGVISPTVYWLTKELLVTDYVKIIQEAGCAVYVCIWYCGPWQAGINDALNGSQSGDKGERYQMLGSSAKLGNCLLFRLCGL